MPQDTPVISCELESAIPTKFDKQPKKGDLFLGATT